MLISYLNFCWNIVKNILITYSYIGSKYIHNERILSIMSRPQFFVINKFHSHRRPLNVKYFMFLNFQVFLMKKIQNFPFDFLFLTTLAITNRRRKRKKSFLVVLCFCRIFTMVQIFGQDFYYRCICSIIKFERFRELNSLVFQLVSQMFNGLLASGESEFKMRIKF